MNHFNDDPIIDPSELRAANQRCEAELKAMGIDPRLPSGIRSAWKPQSLIQKGPLTENKIAQYFKQGWYNADFKKARKDRMQKKTTPTKTQGSFFQRDGRLIYNP